MFFTKTFSPRRRSGVSDTAMAGGIIGRTTGEGNSFFGERMTCSDDRPSRYGGPGPVISNPEDYPLMTTRRLLLTAVLMLVAQSALADPFPTTPCEKSGGIRTPSLAETLTWCRDLAAGSPLLAMNVFGTSAQGRDLAVVVADLEGRISEVEDEQAERSSMLADPAVYDDAKKRDELLGAFQKASSKLEELNTRWEHSLEALEKAQGELAKLTAEAN